MTEHDLEKALEPVPPKKNKLKYVLIGLAALLLIAVGYWVTKEILLKGEVEIPLPAEMANTVSEKLHLDDGKIGPVRISPAKEPDSGASSHNLPEVEKSESGTAGGAGQDAERPSASGVLVEPGHSATDLVTENTPGEERKKIYEGDDAIVTPAFALDLARYLAGHYWPQGSHLSAKNGPYSSASLSAAGQRYGLELVGFASTRPEAQRDYLRDRALVLNYIYKPAMLTALSRLYVDRFADALAEAGLKESRTLDGVTAVLKEEEVAAMLHFYADYSRALGAALQAYTEERDAPSLVLQYTKARENTDQANMHFDEARFRVDNAREMKKEQAVQEALQDMKKAEQEFRKAMLEQEQAKEAVVGFMGKGTARRLDDQELLYIAAWAARRGVSAIPAHEAAAETGDFIGQVLDEKAEELNKQSD